MSVFFVTDAAGYACAVGAARIKRRTYAAAENVAGRTER